MCKGATYFKDDIPLSIKNRLIPLVEDGLIEMDAREVQITTVGKSFLRNICMAFDERLWKLKPEMSLFSNTV